jgi:hypothetical protein
LVYRLAPEGRESAVKGVPGATPNLGSNLQAPNRASETCPSREVLHLKTDYLWKRNHLAVHAAEAPFAWIDDVSPPPTTLWANARTATGSPTVLIRPEHRAGIRPEHLQAVRT